MKVDYSVIIPVFRGEDILYRLNDLIISFFQINGYKAEIIYVFDSGIERSWEVLKSIKSKSKNNIKIIRLTRNYGQHNAIICGIKYSKGNYIVTMDEDLQHNPNDIKILIEKQKLEDYDVVYGKHIQSKHSLLRNMTSKLMKNLLKWGIPDLHQDYSAYRLIKANIAQKILEMHNSYTFLDGYLTWITTHVSSAEVSHSESLAGRSSYTLKKLIKHSINIFITFSDKPITILFYTSFLFFVFSTGYGMMILIQKIIYNNLVSGFASSMILLSFGLGVIMLGLGIIGEYIKSINQKTTNIPNYFEREKFL